MALNRPKFHFILLVRSVSVLTAQYCFYTALTKIEFATACALGFTGPLFITALSIPLLGHRVGLWRWCAIGIGFVGMLTVMKPFDASFSGYMIYPVMAAFGYAISSLLVRLYPEIFHQLQSSSYNKFALVRSPLSVFMPFRHRCRWNRGMMLGFSY